MIHKDILPSRPLIICMTLLISEQGISIALVQIEMPFLPLPVFAVIDRAERATAEAVETMRAGAEGLVQRRAAADRSGEPDRLSAGRRRHDHLVRDAERRRRRAPNLSPAIRLPPGRRAVSAADDRNDLHASARFDRDHHAGTGHAWPAQEVAGTRLRTGCSARRFRSGSTGLRLGRRYPEVALLHQAGRGRLGDALQHKRHPRLPAQRLPTALVRAAD